MREITNLTKYAIATVVYAYKQKKFFWWIGIACIVFSGSVLNDAFIKGNPLFLFGVAGGFLFFGSYLMNKNK